jgi:hypothetical protein
MKQSFSKFLNLTSCAYLLGRSGPNLNYSHVSRLTDHIYTYFSHGLKGISNIPLSYFGQF